MQHLQARVVHSLFGAREWSDTISLGKSLIFLDVIVSMVNSIILHVINFICRVWSYEART